MYTENEKKTAQMIVGNADIVSLLAKVFLDTEDRLTSEIINKKSDKKLGEIVRANHMAEMKVQLRFNHLKKLGQEIEDKEPLTVPK